MNIIQIIVLRFIMDKQEIYNLMISEMSKIINQWDNSGIIIETQYEFASQHIIKYYFD